MILCREALYEDETFPKRELAALVASKVYYHLQEYNESMVFALGAGKLLNLDKGGEFEQTIICRFLFVRPLNINDSNPTNSQMYRYIHIAIC
jgi:hypothetical protein